MSTSLPTASPLRVAIVGSGPSGFYAAEALLESDLGIEVDMYERLPVPFGLVRYGVAPDHPKLKTATLVFDRIAQHPRFSFFGNVHIGENLHLSELRSSYHAVLYCSGAESDRSLNVPGEHLSGCHAATEFVGWYNGHPDYRDRQFDLNQETAVVIGQGNVAADVVRMLCTPIDILSKTDIAKHALEALSQSRVRNVHIVGRRGPAQAKFTTQELRELGELPETVVQLDPRDLELNAESAIELADRKNFISAKNVDLFRSWRARPQQVTYRQISFHFYRSPLRIIGTQRVEGLELAHTRLTGSAFSQTSEPTGSTSVLSCGLLFRSIGYKGRAIDGLPFDEIRYVLTNNAGRIANHADLYCSGWIKRGPSGIIGTNRACAVETTKHLLEDLKSIPRSGEKSGSASILPRLAERAVRVVQYADWKVIDAEEIRQGQAGGKPREKLTRVSEMLDVLSRQSE